MPSEPAFVPTGAGALAAAAGEHGVAVSAKASEPFGLDDPKACWLVEDGALDVFWVERSSGQVRSRHQHVLRADAGRLVFAAGRADEPLAMVARGSLGCRVRRLDIADVAASPAAEEFISQLEMWVCEVAAAVTCRIEPRPHADVLAVAGGEFEADAGKVVYAPAGTDAASCRVVWVRCDGAYLSTERPPPDGSGWMPVTADSWVMLRHDGAGVAASSADLFADGAVEAALGDFHAMAAAAELLNRRLLLADDANSQRARIAQRHDHRDSARSALFDVLESPAAADRRAADADAAAGGDDPRVRALLAALAPVGRYEGIRFQAPLAGHGASERRGLLGRIAEASGVRARRVRLPEGERWWRGDSGALLGFDASSGEPVALLPGRWGRYRALTPSRGAAVTVTADTASGIADEAWFFYRGFAADRPVGLRDVYRLAGRSLASDAAQFAGVGVAAMALLLLPALLVGVIVDRVLPTADGGLLAQTAAGLAAVAFVATLLRMLQGGIVMRLEARAAARLGAALWDRLVDLPPGFFVGTTAGDLGHRMGVFEGLRNQVSGVVVNSVASALLLMPMLAVLFWYSAPLAWFAIAFALFSLLVVGVLGLRQVAPQRRLHDATREQSGHLFGVLKGISKLRSTGAEQSAFATWAHGYRRKQLATLEVSARDQHLLAFGDTMPALATAVLFGAVLWIGGDVSVGDFLVVYTASMTVYGAVVGLGQSFRSLAVVVPMYRECEPVLNALPDRGAVPGTAPVIDGDISFEHVSFRYGDSGPWVLDDVSLRIRPGQFVAIVGDSGAGKSTLLRLALGLEAPTSGGVFHDGVDISHVDRRALRRQLGVVMQDASLMPGSILDNVIGLGHELSIDDAWRAAELASVAEDIADMPMGMFTRIGDSSAIFSGGQVQRIKIAAALAREPRVLFFDEATGWLDGETQAEVMENLRGLIATRVVIAHRLSTIREADKIYVMQAGRIVQEGTYAELAEAPGPFAALIERQVD